MKFIKNFTPDVDKYLSCLLQLFSFHNVSMQQWAS